MFGKQIGILKHPGYNGKGSAPAAPDYTAAANATAAGNLETAKYTTQANRVNQITPYGNLTYSMTPTFDQAAYDKAMSQYQSDLANYNQQLKDYNNQKNYGGILGNLNRGSAPVAPVMPTQSAYNTGGETWTATQTLSPAQQDILNKQNQLSSGLLGAAGTGLDYARGVIERPGVDMSQLPGLQGSVNTSGVPSLQSSISTSGLPQLQSSVTNPNLASSYNIQSATGSVNNPTLQTSANANQQASGNVNNPTLQTSFDISGQPQLTSAISTSNLPGTVSSINPYGNIQNQINTSGLPSTGINPGETYSDAIMRRLAPQMAQQQESFDAKMANQGIAPGTKAYENAYRDFAQGQNDLLTSAQIQGMQTGLAANQQQFAQNAAQQAAINAAQAQGFGQNAQQAALQNAIQEQLFGQNAQQANLQNAANQQAYNQALGIGNFANTAAGQQFGQNLSAQQLANQAAAQNNANALANMQAQNAAANTQFGQNLSAAQLANAAAAQNTGNYANLAQFGNQAAGQQYQQALSNAQLANAAQAQGFGQNAQQAALANTANQQAFQQAQAQAALANAARGQGFQETAYNQMQPINVINALRTGSQVQSPSFVNPAQMQNPGGADILGATQANYNAQLANYNANQAANSGFFGGLMNLGGLYGASQGWFSDENMKENIKEIGALDNGLKIYAFEYKPEYKDLAGHGRFVGVMAQEVEKVQPEALVAMPNGMRGVNYSMLGA